MRVVPVGNDDGGSFVIYELTDKPLAARLELNTKRVF
jgi:hypothetical protein